MFGTILISAATLMHLYVFWRTFSLPWARRPVAGRILIVAALILWVVFFLGRVVGHRSTGTPAAVLEFAGMSWLGILLLTFVSFLAVDLVTLFGLVLRRWVPVLRGGALTVGLALAAAALVQGMRPPAVVEYEVALAGLPDSMDGTVLIALSDMHLGSLVGQRWLAARIRQVNEQAPDLVVLLGDIFEGHGPPAAGMTSTFRQLSPPLGVWAVPGNHEFHHARNLNLFHEAGVTLLRDRWAEVRPGLVVAGVDDLTNARRNGRTSDHIKTALADRPPGAVILLSHTPWQTEKAAESGVGLMLSGHTHGGQIWPFSYLVQRRYPLLAGRYEVEGMTLVVCRGTGTWGPRMRLWHPGEILRVTLRAVEKTSDPRQPTG